MWYHVAGTYDVDGGANNGCLYLNGMLNNTLTSTQLIQTNSDAILLGTHASGLAGYSGWMDNVRIYNRALQSCEVCEHCRIYWTQAQCSNCTNCSGN